ncbi:MAG: dihydrodipicolinate synthase family protein [Phycisphaeraceae bacterium]
MGLNLEGLIAAPHTPFHEDGAFAPGPVQSQADWLAKSGVVGAFIGGTTGEWCSMTTHERQALFDAWAQASSGLARIAHVGHNCQRDAIELARHAASVGMDAVAALAPSFLKPGSAGELASYFAPIAEAAGGLPFYVYHIPGLSGVRVAAHEQIDAYLNAVPGFAGLKFTDPDLHAYARCVAAYGEACELMWGVDEILPAALAYGARSAVGSTYNYAAPLFHSLIAAALRTDTPAVLRESERAIQLVDILIEFGVLRAGKALMTLRGVDCGPPRSPILPLTGPQRDALFERVRRAGLLDPVPVAASETTHAGRV